MRLEPGEQVMVRTRTHPRALLRPAAVLVAVAFLLGLAVGVLARPDLPGLVAANRAVLEAAAWVVAALVLLPGTVRPLWRWVFRRTVVTDRRILQGAGIGGCQKGPCGTDRCQQQARQCEFGHGYLPCGTIRAEVDP